PGATRIDPRSRPCAAEGGRDRCQCRRQEVGRRPHRRSLRDGRELIRNPPDRLWPVVPAHSATKTRVDALMLGTHIPEAGVMGTTVHELTSRTRYEVCAPRGAFRERELAILHWKA